MFRSPISRATIALIVCGGALAAAAPSPSARTSAAASFTEMRWRSIGPFRAGWSTCVEGVPDAPDTFYFGAAVGGIWKTDDAGRTWQPLFQHEAVASVDAVAIAPSNPEVIYAGTGQVETRYDIASGNGVYRSDNGGKTWRHLGLDDTRAIGRLLVDPKNPDIVLAAAFGHIFGPNPERGVFRSDDGGKSWKKTLYVDDHTGAVDLAADPRNPEVVYAATWQVRDWPWLSYFQPEIGPGSGIFKSVDGGKTWKRLGGAGWPSRPLGRIGIAVSSGGRIYAAVDAKEFKSYGPAPSATPSATGLYRSDDGGASWTWVNRESWVGSNYFGRVTPDPVRPDVVYMTGQSIRRSTDGGKTFEVLKGAPGGDDYHFVWINPKHPDHIATASDQGTVISVNGGRTWSSWYNQPTGQFYHLAADDRFPYWIYSGQQDSGTVGIASRSDFGALSFREWHPVGAEERDYDIPDPNDPHVVYGTGLGGNLARFDDRTGQAASVSPHVESTYAQRSTTVKYRYTWITPLAVSARALYQGAQVLFRSPDRGQSWQTISPDLSRAVPGTPGCDGPITLDNAAPCGFGVIYSIALSPKAEGDVWIGTDDGRIQRTKDDGKTWKDVTPRELAPWSKVASLDVSALDPETAYAAVDRQRLDDFSPHAYRTHDGGRTWTSIAAGLPPGNFVDVVRADPVRRGLLYAGTGSGVFCSTDDGDHWRPLQLNLPTTWIRDLLVHGNDLVAGTQGRGIWILDDVSPLREAAEGGEGATRLFTPADAVRLRRNENRDTPLPPETPLGQNPPAGAIIDYFVAGEGGGVATLEIFDPRGNRVRRWASDDRSRTAAAERYFAAEWLKPAPPLSSAPGHHRFVWNLRYPSPPASEGEYTIAAIWGDDTPAEPQGILAPPGRYTVRLTIGGRSESKPFTVKMDPRVTVSPEAITKQFDVASQAASLMERSLVSMRDVAAYIRSHPEVSSPSTGEAAARLTPYAGFERLQKRFTAVFRAVESADSAPTAQAEEELRGARADFEKLEARWKEVAAGK